MGRPLRVPASGLKRIGAASITTPWPQRWRPANCPCALRRPAALPFRAGLSAGPCSLSPPGFTKESIMAPVLSLPLAGGDPDPLPPEDPFVWPDRNLLIRGNKKLGEDVLHFDIPAKTTCPGRSENCSGLVKVSPKAKGSRRCYVLGLYQRFPSLRILHLRNRRA